MVFAVQVHEPTRRAWRNRCRIPPYKRGAAGSNPAAPTKFLQLDSLFETLIGDPVTTAGNHRCMRPDGGRVPSGHGSIPFDHQGAPRRRQAPPRQGSGSVVWLPDGRKGADIRTLSFAPDRSSDAGLAAEEITSWPALTWMRPGQTVPGAVERLPATAVLPRRPDPSGTSPNQAGRLVLDTDGGRPRAPARAEQGACGVPPGSRLRLPRGRGTDRVIPRCRTSRFGPSLAGPVTSGPDPARYRPSGPALPQVPAPPVQPISHPRRPRSAVRTHRDHHHGAARQGNLWCPAYPGRPNSPFPAPRTNHIHT